MCAYVGQPLDQFYEVSLAVLESAGQMRIKGPNESCDHKWSWMAAVIRRPTPGVLHPEALFMPAGKAGLGRPKRALAEV